MAFTYPSSGGSSPAPSLANALQIDADAPALYYTSRGTKSIAASTNWGKESYLTPIMFNRDMTVTKLAQRFNSIPDSGTWPNGGDAWYYIYEGYDVDGINKPKTLVANVGIVNVNNTGGSNKTVTKTLSTPVTFKAYTVYWIGATHGVSDGAGGATASFSGASYRDIRDGGEDPTASTGVTLSEIPFVTLGFNCYYAEEIALAPTWGTAPATLDATLLYPQAIAPLIFVEGEPA